MKKYLVLLLSLVLPATAIAWSIGDIDFDKVGKQIAVKPNPVNFNKATLVIGYPDPIKVIIVMASRCGQGNKVCVDELFYLKDGVLKSYKSLGGEVYDVEVLTPERTTAITNELNGYIGKLSSNDPTDEFQLVAEWPEGKYPTGGGNRYPDIDKWPNLSEPDVASHEWADDFFTIDMDIYKKFGRVYYLRRPVRLEMLPEIRNDFKRFTNRGI